METGSGKSGGYAVRPHVLEQALVYFLKIGNVSGDGLDGAQAHLATIPDEALLLLVLVRVVPWRLQLGKAEVEMRMV